MQIENIKWNFPRLYFRDNWLWKSIQYTWLTMRNHIGSMDLAISDYTRKQLNNCKQSVCFVWFIEQYFINKE